MFCASCSVAKETRMNAQVHDCVKRACVRQKGPVCVCVSLRGQMEVHDALQHNQVLVGQLSL